MAQKQHFRLFSAVSSRGCLCCLSSLVVQVVDFVDLSFREQLLLVRRTDLLVGVHGAGLTHALFLPPGAHLIEFATGGGNHFSNLARYGGVRYHALDFHGSAGAQLFGFSFCCLFLRVVWSAPLRSIPGSLFACPVLVSLCSHHSCVPAFLNVRCRPHRRAAADVDRDGSDARILVKRRSSLQGLFCSVAEQSQNRRPRQPREN